MSSSMIYIVGAGAIGKSLAAFLKMTGKEVVLVRGSADDLENRVEQVCIKMPDGNILKTVITVQTFSGISAIKGTVLVTSKAYGNEFIAQKLASKGLDVPIILLQNGLHIEDAFVNLGFNRLFRCVLMVTSQIDEQGIVSFKPVASCPVGVIAGKENQLAAVLEPLQNPWFLFHAEDHIQPIVWKKVIVNCVFNSICPLLETDNSVFYQSTIALKLAERIISECTAIALKCGIDIDPQEIRQSLLNISRMSAGQYISTLQDIRNHRPTEIRMLNHEIVRLAAGFHSEHLVQQTRILGELIDIKSSL